MVPPPACTEAHDIEKLSHGTAEINKHTQICTYIYTHVYMGLRTCECMYVRIHANIFVSMWLYFPPRWLYLLSSGMHVTMYRSQNQNSFVSLISFRSRHDVKICSPALGRYYYPLYFTQHITKSQDSASRYSDWLCPGTQRGRRSSPIRIKNFLFSKTSSELCGPPSLLSNG
jgi:hypothetical protein